MPQVLTRSRKTEMLALIPVQTPVLIPVIRALIPAKAAEAMAVAAERSNTALNTELLKRFQKCLRDTFLRGKQPPDDIQIGN